MLMCISHCSLLRCVFPFYLMKVFVEWLSALLGWKRWEERHQVDFGHLCFPTHSLYLAHSKVLFVAWMDGWMNE